MFTVCMRSKAEPRMDPGGFGAAFSGASLNRDTSALEYLYDG